MQCWKNWKCRFLRKGEFCLFWHLSFLHDCILQVEKSPTTPLNTVSANLMYADILDHERYLWHCQVFLHDYHLNHNRLRFEMDYWCAQVCPLESLEKSPQNTLLDPNSFSSRQSNLWYFYIQVLKFTCFFFPGTANIYHCFEQLWNSMFRSIVDVTGANKVA